MRCCIGGCYISDCSNALQQSILPSYSQLLSLKPYPSADTSQTAVQRGMHAYYITKWGSVEALTRRSRQVSEARCLPLTLQPLEFHLKSPSSSHLLHPLPLQLPLHPGMGCWVHTIHLCRLRESKGQGTKVSFKCVTPAIYTTYHFPLQSWVHLFFIKNSFSHVHIFFSACTWTSTCAVMCKPRWRLHLRVFIHSVTMLRN